MSDQSPLRSFKDAHIHYVMEQFEKGEDSVRIAEGLNSHPHFNRLVGQVDFSGNDVAGLLERFKVRTPEDAARIGSILKSTTTGHGGGMPPMSVQPAPAVRPMSAASAKRTSVRPSAKTGAKKPAAVPSPSEEFEEKAAPLDEMEKMLGHKRDDAKVSFKPVLPKDFIQGQTYVYPGIGAVVFQGKKEIEAGGFKTETFTFQERFTTQFGSPQTVHVPKSQLAARGVYELPPAQIIDDVLYKLRHGKNEIKGMPKLAEARKKFFDQFMATAKLSDLADVVIFGFRDPTPASQTQMGILAGNKAVRVLGSIVAAIKDMTLEEGESLINRASRRPTMDQLAGYNDGRMPAPVIK